MFIDISLSKAHGLVGAQFFLILLAVIPFSGRPFPDSLGIGLLCAGLILGAWTLKTNSPENFNISPLPKIGARLCFDGPYKLCRHPMYMSLLMVVVGIALCNHSLTNGIACVLLALVLDFKARMEEQLLQSESGDYRGYLTRTRRFIPFIY
jgi:protein-S-isoprenylcysteine O-methyltransferase Ste14